MVEKRQQKRFKLDSEAFASLSYRFTVLGKILNLSENGLAFSYVASQQRSDESPFVDIVLTDGRFHFRKIPFKTVWDKPMFQEFSSGPISIRHCGIQFGELTEKQATDLKCLLGTCSPINGPTQNRPR